MSAPGDVGPVGQAGHLFVACQLGEKHDASCIGRCMFSLPGAAACCGLPASAHPASKSPADYGEPVVHSVSRRRRLEAQGAEPFDATCDYTDADGYYCGKRAGHQSEHKTYPPKPTPPTREQLDHERHMTDGTWHDGCERCLERRNPLKRPEAQGAVCASYIGESLIRCALDAGHDGLHAGPAYPTPPTPAGEEALLDHPFYESMALVDSCILTVAPNKLCRAPRSRHRQPPAPPGADGGKTRTADTEAVGELVNNAYCSCYTPGPLGHIGPCERCRIAYEEGRVYLKALGFITPELPASPSPADGAEGLRACPFCGSAAWILPAPHGYFRAACSGCCVNTGAARTEAEAIAAWNRRRA